jgi:cellulose synthase/poly-beta-1,6-N-acetylglucosamine synthase-like glycosyltransferase
MRVLFWSSVAILVATYVLFPVFVLLRGRTRPRPYAGAAHTPTVSIIIAAHNEAATIAEKLENVLDLDYPAHRLEVIVASDGSDDATVQIAERFTSRNVRVLALPRGGKAHALNAGIAAARGGVLVFTDANSMFERQAIRALVHPLADPRVGAVAGDQRYRPGADSGLGDGERRYWDLDRLQKVAQSRAGSATSATGAIYAIRRSVVDPVPDGVTDDFFLSTGAIAQGLRLVFAADAVSWEPVAASAGDEWRRKVRVITRGLRSIVARRELLDPRRTGFYAVQLLFHKVLRRMMVGPLLLLLVAAPALWAHGVIYQGTALGQLAVYTGAALGASLPRLSGPVGRALHLCAYFVLVNAACARAVGNVLTGRRVDRWEPNRLVTG